MVLEDGSLLGAQATKFKVGSRTIPPGVEIRPPNYEDFSHRIGIRVNMDATKAAAIEAFWRGQIGKPYDWRGVFGFVIGFEKNRDWRDPSSWFCDEGIVRSFEVGKFFDHPIAYPADHLTPGDALVLLSPWSILEYDVRS